MGKLGTFPGSEICRILAKNGFVQIRQKSSHIVMQKRLENSTATVPVPNHKEIRIGTLRSIIWQSGLPKQLFEV